MNVVINCIAVRMKSKRLSQKALLSLSGKPVLWHLVDRVSRSKRVKQSVVCTSDLPEDDPLEEFCRDFGFHCYRGHPDKVLQRFLVDAQNFNADHIVRITGDNPLTDPQIIDEMVDTHLRENADYTFTEDPPRGTRPEIISVTALEKCLRSAQNPEFSEYMTLYFKNHPKIFKNIKHSVKNPALIRPQYAVTIDTQNDFDVVEAIYNRLYKTNPNFTLVDVIQFLDAHPEIDHADRIKLQLAPNLINTKLNEEN